MPRHRAVLALSVVVLTLASACNSNAAVPEAGGSPSPAPTSSAPTSSAPTSSAPTTPVTLRLRVYGSKARQAAYRRMAHDYSEHDPDVDVRVVGSPTAAASLRDLRNAYEDGDPPDLFLAPREQLPTLMGHRWTQPVDHFLAQRGVDFGDGYQREGLLAFSADTSLQCMPHDVSPLVVYYNRDLVNLRALGEDAQDSPTPSRGWSFEEFARAARQVPRAHPGTQGVYLDPTLDMLAPFIWSGGGDLTDDGDMPTRLTLSKGGNPDVLAGVLDLFRDPHVTLTPQQLRTAGAVKRFRQGRLGMIFGYRSLTPRLRQNPDLDFNVMPLPEIGSSYSTITPMNGYCLSSRTEHPQQAADFLAYAIGDRGASTVARAGFVEPANLEVAHSRVFTQPGLPPQSSFIFVQSVRSAQRPPLDPDWVDVVHATQPLLDRLFYAPVFDLDRLLQRIDRVSASVFKEPSPSASPGATASPTATPSD